MICAVHRHCCCLVVGISCFSIIEDLLEGFITDGIAVTLSTTTGLINKDASNDAPKPALVLAPEVGAAVAFCFVIAVVVSVSHHRRSPSPSSSSSVFAVAIGARHRHRCQCSPSSPCSSPLFVIVLIFVVAFPLLWVRQ